MNILSSLINILKNKPSSVLFNRNSKEITAREFLSDIKTLAEKLNSTSQHRWALCYHDSYLFAVALFSALLANKNPILLPNNQTGTIKDFHHEFDAILSDIPEINSEELAEIAEIADFQLDEKQEITIFTSGSTGKPKKISRTLKRFMNEIEVLEATFGKEMSEVAIYSTVSHQHIYGLLFIILWPLCAQRIICLPMLNYPEEIESILTRHQSATLVTSPALLARMPDKSIATKQVTVFSSGNLLKKHDAEKLLKNSTLYPIEILGSTETGGIAFRQQLKNKNWMPLEKVKIQLDQETQCLKVCSPFFSENEITMGDKVILNDNGTFQLLERADRIVKIEGKRVSLPEIEEKLKSHSLVQEAYLISQETTRQSIAAIIVLTREGELLLKTRGKLSLNATFKDFLTPYFSLVLLPKQFRYINALPRNSQGKIIVAEIQKLFEINVAKYPEIKNHEQLENETVLQLFIPKEIIYFNGHFPGSPILPGVVQVDWAIHFANQLFNIPKALLTDIEQVKFTKVIPPDSFILLSLKIEKNKLIFCYSHDGTLHSRGKIKVGST